jgi:hypothetical protein
LTEFLFTREFIEQLAAIEKVAPEAELRRLEAALASIVANPERSDRFLTALPAWRSFVLRALRPVPDSLFSRDAEWARRLPHPVSTCSMTEALYQANCSMSLNDGAQGEKQHPRSDGQFLRVGVLTQERIEASLARAANAATRRA